MALHEKLQFARKQIDLTLDQVCARTGISAPSLSSYENGHREPSFSQLAKLAKVYHRPVEFFLSDEPIKKEMVLWRVKPSSPSAAELEAKLLEMGAWYRAVEVWNDRVIPCELPKYPIDSKTFTEADAAKLASRVRSALGLGDRPGASLLLVLEEAGVKVFHLPFEPRSASASTVSETFGEAVLLNARADRRTRTYALAHELFHLLTWGTAFESEQLQERLADIFAAHLLLPEEPVKLLVNRVLHDGKATFRELDAIARSFDAPLEPLLWRIGDIFARPRKDTRRDILRLRASGEFAQPKLAEPAPCRPNRFEQLAVKAYEDGKLSLGRLAEYLGISRQEAMRRYFDNGKESIANEEVAIASSGR